MKPKDKKYLEKRSKERLRTKAIDEGAYDGRYNTKVVASGKQYKRKPKHKGW